METKIYFFNENDTKESISKLMDFIKHPVEGYINIITSKKYNNKIGYFQFLDSSSQIYYKFYIMPKIYKVKESEYINCESCQENFIKFFRHYYRIIDKHDISDYPNPFEGNISDLSYNSHDSAKELATDAESVDDFIVHNYNDSLSVIERFFTKHKKQILVEHDFQSQSIKSKLNIRRNMIEPNKSSVHQTKKVPMIYSNIAVIAMEVLYHFINIKIRNFTATSKSKGLKRKANKIQNTLKQKFSNNHDLTFKVSELLQRKTSKLFEKNHEYKNVYKALLKLTGKEHYYNGDVYREIQKEDEMISIFLQPEKLYEWILYDELVSNKVFDYDEVLKDGKDNVKKPFELIPAYDDKKKYSSEPDLIVLKDDKEYPVDAKWKVLNTKNASFDNDIAKLRRDAKIRGVNKGYLIYPKIDESSKFQLDIEYRYDFDDFRFELKVVNVV